MKSLSKILFISLFAGIGMAVGYFAGKSIKHFPELKNQVAQLTLIDAVLLPIGFLFVLAVHELGHLIGGRLRQMRFLLFVVGPFQFSQSVSGIRFNLVWNLGTFGGLVAMLPNPDRPLKKQLISLISGGPIASLLLACLGFFLFTISNGTAALHGICIGFISSMIFLVTAIPTRAGGFMSDGMQLIETLNGGKAIVFRQKFNTLYAQSLAGVRPRDWDQQLLSDVLSDSSEMDALRQTAAWYFEFLSAIDRNNAATAEKSWTVLAERYTDFPVGMRQGLTLELCLYSLQKGDVASARNWHEKSSGGIIDKSRRSLADAWLEFATGHNSVALQRIEKAKTQLRHSMDPGVAVMTKDQLDWLTVQILSKA